MCVASCHRAVSSSQQRFEIPRPPSKHLEISLVALGERPAKSARPRESDFPATCRPVIIDSSTNRKGLDTPRIPSINTITVSNSPLSFDSTLISDPPPANSNPKHFDISAISTQREVSIAPPGPYEWDNYGEFTNEANIGALDPSLFIPLNGRIHAVTTLRSPCTRRNSNLTRAPRSRVFATIDRALVVFADAFFRP